MNIKITMNLEVGYRVEVLDINGFVTKSIDIGSDELPELIRELCEQCVDTDSEVEQLLTMLRQGYEVFNLKSIVFRIKES